MSIALHAEIFTPELITSKPMAKKRIKFESRKPEFCVESAEHDFYAGGAVSFNVGPIWLSLSADEAEALAKAMFQCAQHFRKEVAKKTGKADEPEGGGLSSLDDLLTAASAAYDALTDERGDAVFKAEAAQLLHAALRAHKEDAS